MRPMCPCRTTSLWAHARTSLLVFPFLTITWVVASAQVDRAVLEGTATDATGAVIRGANVEVLAVDRAATRNS